MRVFPAKSQSRKVLNLIRIVNHGLAKLSLLCDQIRISLSMTLEFLLSGGTALTLLPFPNET